MKVIEGHFYKKDGRNWVETEYSVDRNNMLCYVDGELMLDSAYHEWMDTLTECLLDSMKLKYITKRRWIKRIVRESRYNGTAEYIVYAGEASNQYRYNIIVKE